MNMKISKKTNVAVTTLLKYCGLILTTGVFKEPLHTLSGALDLVGSKLNFKYPVCKLTEFKGLQHAFISWVFEV